MAQRDSVPPRPRVIRPHVTQAPYPSPERNTPHVQPAARAPLEKPRTGILHLPDAQTERQPAWVSPTTQDTGELPPQPDIDALKAQWQEKPVWDIEWATGYELMREDLSRWHHEQIAERARALGCSVRMAYVLEELARCWLNCTPPRSELARRVLRYY